MYSILLFEEDEVEVVPKSWVVGKRCYWPDHLKGPALTKSIERGQPPDSEWGEYSIVSIVKECGDYKKARAKCRRLEESLSTDLDTTDVECKSRKRRRPEKYRQDTNTGCSSDQTQESVTIESNQVHTLPDVPTLREFELPPVTPQRKASQSIVSDHSQDDDQQCALFQDIFHDDEIGTSASGRSTDNSRLETTIRSPVVHKKALSTPTAQSVPRGDAIVGLPVDSYERDTKVFTILLELKNMVRSTMCTVNRLVDKIDGRNQPEEPVEEFNFPLNSTEDVRRVEEMLGEKPNFKLLVRYLCGLGGLTIKDIVSRIMTLVFTTQLARQFNWTGQGTTNKHAMKKLRLTAAVKDATRNKATEAEVEAAINTWLKNAIDRDGGRKRRADKKKEKDAERVLKVVRARAILASDSDSES